MFIPFSCRLCFIRLRTVLILFLFPCLNPAFSLQLFPNFRIFKFLLHGNSFTMSERCSRGLDLFFAELAGGCFEIGLLSTALDVSGCGSSDGSSTGLLCGTFVKVSDTDISISSAHSFSFSVI
jgi:hypothetical protein